LRKQAGNPLANIIAQHGRFNVVRDLQIVVYHVHLYGFVIGLVQVRRSVFDKLNGDHPANFDKRKGAHLMDLCYR